MEMLDLTVVQAHEAIAAGELAAAEYAEAWAASAAEDELNAYLWRSEGAAAEGAIAVEKPTAAPVAVKDIFCTEGVPTTAGSRILEGYRPPYTATAVRRLLEPTVVAWSNFDVSLRFWTTWSVDHSSTLRSLAQNIHDSTSIRASSPAVVRVRVPMRKPSGPPVRFAGFLRRRSPASPGMPSAVSSIVYL